MMKMMMMEMELNGDKSYLVVKMLVIKVIYEIYLLMKVKIVKEVKRCYGL